MTATAAPIDLDVYREAIERATNVEDIRAIRLALTDELEAHWEPWLRYLFPGYVTAGFAAHHVEFWDWVWSIDAGQWQVPGIGVWGRGQAKSTSAELAIAALGARGRRNYVLYVCATQDQADDHVGNIGAMLESDRIADHYPGLGEKLVNKFGSQRGWRRNRLRTASGFTVDAIGLDSAARGAKLDEDRPDLVVFDDIDDGDDSPKVTQRKVDQLTRTFLPTLVQGYGAALAMQNLVLPDGVFARIAGVGESSADFLQDRVVFGGGLVPAVTDLVLGVDDEGKDIVLSGEPTWDGQDLETVQVQVRTWGRTAFLIEAQHEVELRSGGKFEAWEWMRGRWEQENMPADAIRCRAWDQAGTEFDGKNDPDWTAGVRWAYEDGLYRIEDVVRFRHSAGKRDEIMRAVAIADAEEFGLDGVAQLIERRPGDLGRDEANRMVREVFRGFTAHKVAPIGTKEDRAAGLASAMENELVTIVEQDASEHRSGTRAFLAEHQGFPLLGHDDQVDAAAHGFNWIRKRAEGGGSSTGAEVRAALGPLRRR